jgi:hypothetical protein
MGNPWLWAAVTAGGMAAVKEFFPDFSKGTSTCGAYRLRVTVQGEDRDVVIDDLIPCYVTSAGSAPEPAFGYTDVSNELWWMLVVKAFAKVLGSYEAVVSPVSPAAVVTDMSGAERSQLEGVRTTLGVVQMLRSSPEEGLKALQGDDIASAAQLATMWSESHDRPDITYPGRAWKTTDLPAYTITVEGKTKVTMRVSGPMPADLAVEHYDPSDRLLATKPLKAHADVEFEMLISGGRQHVLQLQSNSHFGVQAFTVNFEADAPISIGLKSAS